ncbi:hypothetical protein, partial [Enterobacter hormaechei]
MADRRGTERRGGRGRQGVFHEATPDRGRKCDQPKRFTPVASSLASGLGALADQAQLGDFLAPLRQVAGTTDTQ